MAKEPPPTYNEGSRRIDDILMSGTLKSSQRGFLAFDLMPSNHRVLYIDIKIKSFICRCNSSIPSHAAWRLKLDDPTVVKKYQTEVERILLSEGAFHEAKQLKDYVQLTGNFDEKAETAFETLDSIRVEAMKKQKNGVVNYEWVGNNGHRLYREDRTLSSPSMVIGSTDQGKGIL